ncbi:MAG: hypothetical protein QOE47_2978 [Pyrinomonadaceae bacterium]|jgi:hypothetical protein|nr:hypothetical protein [Pyrinomonadaceae bacterium]
MRQRPLLLTAAATALGLLLILAPVPGGRAQQQCTGSSTITDSNTTIPFTQTGRLTPNGVASTCAAQKTFPGVTDSNQRRFKAYQFVNNNTSTACITVTLNAGSCVGASSLFSAAYTGFNPGNISMNYLGDIGASPNPSRSYSFNVPAGADFQVVVSQANTNQSCAAYTLTVSGFGCLPQSELIISEFRFGVQDPSVETSALDEYIELYNNTDAPLNVTTADNSAGWALVAADGAVRGIVPVGTTIPARGHYLFANSQGYSLADYPAGSNSTATPDATYTQDIPLISGVALFRTANPANFTLANRLDAVGASSVPSLYRENGLTTFPVSSQSTNYFHVRKMTSGFPQDTGDNANDFALVTLGSDSGATLGAPGPENRSSPIQRNSTVKASLLDPSVTSGFPPNRARSGTPVANGAFGTLTLRRSFRNMTGAPVTRLRFRVVDITTRGNTQAGQADLRVVNSTPEVVVVGGGASVTVQGVRLEEPPEQFSGGGLNSSLDCCVTPEVEAPPGTRTVSLDEPLADGDSINIQFRLGVQQEGSFRFFVNVEAETSEPIFTAPQHRQLKTQRTKGRRASQP